MALSANQLLYTVDERPPLLTTLVLGISHLTLVATVLIWPILIVSAASGTSWQAVHMIQAVMLVMGIGTLLMAIKTRFLGSGYFLCMLYDPSYSSFLLIAAKIGGLPLVYTINYVQSLLQIIFSDGLVRLRRFFPTEITGLVIFMIGISIISVSVANALGGADRLQDLRWSSPSCIVSASTLLVMVAVTVWGGKRWAHYGLALGVIVGLGLSVIFHLFKPFPHSTHTPLFSLPTFASFHIHLLRWDYLLPICAAVLSVSLKAMGDIIAVQKVNSTNWTAPNLKDIREGMQTTAYCSFLSCLIGGLPMGLSAANVGLSITTKITSRILALPVGIAFIALSFFPKVSVMFTLIPKAIIGAMLIFVIVSVLLAGIQIMLSKAMDARKMFVIGLPLVIGLAFEFLPQLQQDVPHFLYPIVASPLTTATLLAILLNLIFQIGVKT